VDYDDPDARYAWRRDFCILSGKTRSDKPCRDNQLYITSTFPLIPLLRSEAISSINPARRPAKQAESVRALCAIYGKPTFVNLATQFLHR